MKQRIALITHTTGGGVWTVARFLYQVIRQSQRFTADLFLLATSACDSASVRLLSPRTWLRSPQIIHVPAASVPYHHVGAFLTEFEFQRYQPRFPLTNLLNEYDLIQMIAGTPAWAAITRHVKPPVCLFAATMVEQERVALIRRTDGWRKFWSAEMTRRSAKIEKQALNSVTHVFAESEYTLQLLAPMVPPEHLQLGVPGVNTQQFSPLLTYNEDGYILSVGRLTDPRKNIRLLLDAYRLLCQKMPNAPRLVLAGKIDMANHQWFFRILAKEELNVSLSANVTQDALPNLYRHAGLFVLSSDEEGLGMVLLEAMASGLPIVSTDCGGPATAVRQNVTGLLTPVGDAEALANAMHQLLQDPARRRAMGQAARNRVEQNFSFEVAGKVYLDRYAELLGR